MFADAGKRPEVAFREEGLEEWQVPRDLPIEAIAREVQESWQQKARTLPVPPSCARHDSVAAP